MTVYKYYLKSAYKNLGMILLYILMYLVLMFTIRGPEIKDVKDYRPQVINLGYIDRDKSQVSKGLIDYLGKKDNMTSLKLSEDEIKEEIFLSRQTAIIEIPKGFGESPDSKGIKLYKNPNNMESIGLDKKIDKYLTFFKAYGFHKEDSLKKVEKVLDVEVDIDMIGDKSGYSQADRLVGLYFNMGAYFMTMIYIQIFCKLSLEMKDEDLLDRILVSSKKLGSYSGEIYLGQISLGFILNVLFIFIALLMNGSYLGEVEMGKYIVATSVFSVSIMGMAFLITNISKNKYFLTGIATSLSLGVAFISGSFVEQSILPKSVLKIARLFPQYFYIKANNKNMASIFDIKDELIIMLLFALVYFIMGLAVSKGKDKINL